MKTRFDAATPAPWVQWEGHRSIHQGPAAKNTPGMFLAKKKNTKMICEVDDLDYEEYADEMQATIDLIAAAPDLLKVACELAELVARVLDTENPRNVWREKDGVQYPFTEWNVEAGEKLAAFHKVVDP